MTPYQLARITVKYSQLQAQLAESRAELAEHKATPLGAKINELIIERGDLRAEVERLSRENQEMDAQVYSACHRHAIAEEKLATQAAEGERLREKLAFWDAFDKENRDSWDHVGERLDAQAAEIERLRASLKRWEDEEATRASCCVANEALLARAVRVLDSYAMPGNYIVNGLLHDIRQAQAGEGSEGESG